MLDNALLAAPVLFGGALLASVFAAFDTWTVVFIVLTILGSIAAFFAYERRDDGYLGATELRAISTPDRDA